MMKFHTKSLTKSPAVACLFLALTTAGLCPAETVWVDGGSPTPTEDGSPEAPFRTIGKALQTVQPSDVVTVRAGVYREQFKIPSGEPGRPITLRAADGQRAIVSGCVPVTGWTKATGGVWTTTLDFEPERLLVAAKEQTIAREPNEGWWRSAGAAGDTLSDPEHLQGIPAAETGGEVRVWLQHGNTFMTFPLLTLDARQARVSVDRGTTTLNLTAGDKYFLQNRAEFIDRPGEWAVQPDAGRFKLSFMPRDEADLARVEAPRLDRALIDTRDRSHIRIEGLEVTGSRQFGIQVYGSSDVQVRRCIVHANRYLGILLREVEDVLVAQNVVRRNEYGISVGYSRRVTVEENDVGHNGVDGILVTWNSDDITVQRNCVHHHLLWGHPDNLQVYRGVTNVRFRDNLLLAGGQSVMMEETSQGEFSGNMVVGCGAYMLIMGHQNAGHYKIHGNTLAFSGYGCMNLTWEDYDVCENVMTTGHDSVLFGTKGIRDYRGDRNVFWNSARSQNPTIIATDDGWHRDFQAVQRSTGEDQHSVYADPRFRNAPVAFRVLDSGRLDRCTKETWYLRGGAQGFEAGDFVEVNFDGVRRRITRLDEATITVAPPLEEKPVKGWLVANWGENSDFRLDLRLKGDSPGANLSAEGGPVGSKIDVQAYLRGDFDGDGQRDLPLLPPEFKED
ncbi:MAG TPA: right-handed parallel beta-helix repeat-containing protein [Thermoguttaceae bacterium]|nr:right-handed parallel beta-helix repeat-containing protein [Thermoguttaceae bacterium]